MTPESDKSGEHEAISLSPELESLLWNSGELASRVETLAEAKVLAALHAHRPSPLEVSDEDCQRFDQFVTRYRVIMGDLRSDIATVFRNPDIRDAQSIAEKVRKGLADARGKVSQFLETARAKGNGPVLAAIERALEPLTAEIDLKELEELAVFEALEKVPAGAELGTSRFFTKKDVMEEKASAGTQRGIIRKESGKKASGSEKTETREQVPEFRWSWEDRELFAEKKLQRVFVFKQSKEEIKRLVLEMMATLAVDYENYMRKMDVVGEAFQLRKTRFAAFSKKFAQDLYNGICRSGIRMESLPRLEKDAIQTIVEPWEEKDRNASESAKAAIRSLFQKFEFEEKKHLDAQCVNPDEIVCFHGIAGEQCSETRESIESLSNTFKKDTLDRIRKSKGRLREEKGAQMHALLNVIDGIVKKKVAALPEKMPFSKRSENIAFWKGLVADFLHAIAETPHGTCDDALAMNIKNDASFVLSYKIRFHLLQETEGVDWHPEEPEVVERALRDFYPKPPETKKAAAVFHWSWTDAELFGQKKLPQYLRLEHGKEQLLELWMQAENAMMVEGKKWWKENVRHRTLVANSPEKEREVENVMNTFRMNLEHVKETTIIPFIDNPSREDWFVDDLHVSLMEVLTSYFEKSTDKKALFIHAELARFFADYKKASPLQYLLPQEYIDTGKKAYVTNLAELKQEGGFFSVNAINMGMNTKEIHEAILRYVAEKTGREIAGNHGNKVHEAAALLRKKMIEHIAESCAGAEGRFAEKIPFIRAWKKFNAELFRCASEFSFPDLPDDVVIEIKNATCRYMSRFTRMFLFRELAEGKWNSAESDEELRAELEDYYPRPPIAEGKESSPFRWSWTDAELFAQYKLTQLQVRTRSIDEIDGFWSDMEKGLFQDLREWWGKVMQINWRDKKLVNMENKDRTTEAIMQEFQLFLGKAKLAIGKVLAKGLHLEVDLNECETKLMEGIHSFWNVPSAEICPTFARAHVAAFFERLRESRQVPYILGNEYVSSEKKAFVADASLSKITGAVHEAGLIHNMLTYKRLIPMDFQEFIVAESKKTMDDASFETQKSDIYGAGLSLLKQMSDIEQLFAGQLSVNEEEHVGKWREFLGKSLAAIAVFSHHGLSEEVLASIRNAASFYVSWHVREVTLRSLTQYRWEEGANMENVRSMLDDFYPDPVARESQDDTPYLSRAWVSDMIIGANKRADDAVRKLDVRAFVSDPGYEEDLKASIMRGASERIRGYADIENIMNVMIGRTEAIGRIGGGKTADTTVRVNAEAFEATFAKIFARSEFRTRHREFKWDPEFLKTLQNEEGVRHERHLSREAFAKQLEGWISEAENEMVGAMEEHEKTHRGATRYVRDYFSKARDAISQHMEKWYPEKIESSAPIIGIATYLVEICSMGRAMLNSAGIDSDGDYETFSRCFTNRIIVPCNAEIEAMNSSKITFVPTISADKIPAVTAGRSDTLSMPFSSENAPRIEDAMARSFLKTLLDGARESLASSLGLDAQRKKDELLPVLLKFRKLALEALKRSDSNGTFWAYLGHALDQTADAFDGKVFDHLKTKLLAWRKNVETQTGEAEPSSEAESTNVTNGLLAVYDIAPDQTADRIAAAASDHVAQLAAEALATHAHGLDQEEFARVRSEMDRIIGHASATVAGAGSDAADTDAFAAVFKKGLDAALTGTNLPPAIADALRSSAETHVRSLDDRKDEADIVEFIMERAEGGRTSFAHTADMLAVAKAEESARREEAEIDAMESSVAQRIDAISRAIRGYARQAKGGGTREERDAAKDEMQRLQTILDAVTGILSKQENEG